MATVSDFDMAADLWNEAVYLHGVLGPRAEIVERDAHLEARRDRRGVRPQQVGQLAQHPQYFALLGGLGRAQLVAELDDFRRLDEQRAAGGGFVVQDRKSTR